ncbi:MAG: MotE family protein [Geminicoccaceae bacterium]
MSTIGPAAGPFGRLSWLLVATALALLLPLAGRVAALWNHRLALDRAPVAVVSTEVARATRALIEPAAGPEPPPVRTPPPPQPSPPPASPAASSDPPLAAALEELASELQRRQAAIAEREQTLALREAVVRSVESRVAGQISRLESLNGDLERRLGQLSADEQARIAQLVKVYEAMKAKSAAMIFDPMALDLLLPIMRGMRDTKVAAIVAEMDPAKARALTAELAGSREPPPP